MKRWNIRISDEAKKDYYKLDGSLRKQVLAGILKVAEAPLPTPKGYGRPLGNKYGKNLTGFFKSMEIGFLRIYFKSLIE